MMQACFGSCRHGFTLIEVLVALMVAGLLTAMVASLMGRGIVASSALEEMAQGQESRVTLRRILDMDIRNMTAESEFTITEQGFSFSTSHNHLIPGPLPVTATWTFADNRIVRNEEHEDLKYAQTQILARTLPRWEAAFFDLTDAVWLDARAWLRIPDRPAPAGLRLRLVLEKGGFLEIIQRLPLQAEEGAF